MKDLEKINLVRSKLNIGLSVAKELIEKFSDIDLAIASWQKQIEDEEKANLNKKYDSLNKFYYFENEYCYPTLSDSDKLEINAFANNYCSQLWNKYVSESKKHLMLINNPEEWKIKNEIKKEYNWQNDWNETNTEAFSENVKSLIDWEEDDEVMFFWNKYSGIESKWRIICKYWISFLYDDESNIIINPKNKKVIILSTNGNLSIAERD
ncbi:DUF2947 family protein [Flavobacterium hydatis]|uniref:Uncharacterized protein n=1 Tax=Flavobacterium hydatis TaxID=991 RepID=A0A086AH94_FLAHY|nr:DUF2947 family protein [Flavobacterium hydatis]KFF16058.1 hypothetical protein IW20_11985 [Flavobacterium hydatis]OXA97596.1 hypothetical protein B0A62_01675 [Flavobacterium hydatis]